jgi:hypothetical protein
MPPTEPKSAMTMVFIPELCEMNLRGLRVLSNLKILMIGRLMFSKDASMIEVTTMKKSSYDHVSRK